jgi:hypothetical protein
LSTNEINYIAYYHTYIKDPKCNKYYACNLIPGGDTPHKEMLLSRDDANKIRKLAAKLNIGEKSLSDEYEFVLAACKYYHLPKPTLQNIRNNVAERILKNTAHPDAYYKISRDELNDFSDEELGYFDKYNGA